MFRFLPILILVFALTACTEGSYERHESYFYPQRPDGQLLYADQTMDTTLIYSLDSWQATKEGDWFSITPESFEVKPGVSIFNKMTFTTTPNTTGKGRNYLIPQGKAVIASPSAKKVLAENLKQRAHKLAKIKADAEELAAKLGAIEPITIATKVSATGAIYGSVNSLHISEALAKLGFEVDRKSIVVKEVKEVGSYSATVKLHKEVSVEIPFTVVAEAAEA